MDTENKKLYLCFWVGDGGDRESYSVFYSKLVLAGDKDEALDKYISSGKNFGQDKEYYDAIEMKVIK
jgi:hypothetical protein